MSKNNQPVYETVIGLEVHLQFNTATKIFCGCANIFGEAPNTQVCPVCMGLPGSLPVMNAKALEDAVKVALALNCRINTRIKFDRKNYYYPDLPKGYQISQYDMPVGEDGYVDVLTDTGQNRVRIHRAHIEEDAGKLIHDPVARCSLVDYNRAGTPLMEIVTEPDLRSPEEAYLYLQTLKLLLQYLNVSDCDMEKGSLRCDANISLRPKGQRQLGTKTELKNMNSFKAVRSALAFEESRQTHVLASGQAITQETRLWDENRAVTAVMRSKEEAHDYRYFPEPDLVPFQLSPDYIEGIRDALPEFPNQKFVRLQSTHGLSAYDARILVQDPLWADFFEECLTAYPQAKKIANWIIGPLLKELNDRKTGLAEAKLTAGNFCQLIRKVEEGVVSNLAGKDILTIALDTGEAVEQIIKEKSLAQISDEKKLEAIIEQICAQHAQVVEQIKNGKDSACGFLVGQVMRQTQGKANPKIVNDMIKRRIGNG